MYLAIRGYFLILLNNHICKRTLNNDKLDAVKQNDSDQEELQNYFYIYLLYFLSLETYTLTLPWIFTLKEDEFVIQRQYLKSKLNLKCIGSLSLNCYHYGSSDNCKINVYSFTSIFQIRGSYNIKVTIRESETMFNKLCHVNVMVEKKILVSY